MIARENGFTFLKRSMLSFRLAQRLRQKLRIEKKLSKSYLKRLETQQFLADLYKSLYDNCKDTAINYFLEMSKKQEVNFNILFRQSRTQDQTIGKLNEELKKLSNKFDDSFLSLTRVNKN